MSRIGSMLVVAVSIMALVPAAGSAQEAPAEDIAPYAFCADDGGQMTCEVTDEVSREDLELTRDPSDPGTLVFPDEQEPARPTCAEGQVACVVADELVTP